jgi:hypothetical protein
MPLVKDTDKKKSRPPTIFQHYLKKEMEERKYVDTCITYILQLLKGMLDWNPISRLRAHECLLAPLFTECYTNNVITHLYEDEASCQYVYNHWNQKFYDDKIKLLERWNTSNLRGLPTPFDENNPLISNGILNTHKEDPMEVEASMHLQAKPHHSLPKTTPATDILYGLLFILQNK